MIGCCIICHTPLRQLNRKKPMVVGDIFVMDFFKYLYRRIIEGHGEFYFAIKIKAELSINIFEK